MAPLCLQEKKLTMNTTYTQHSSFFQYGKMKIINDLYAQVHLKSEPLAVYLNANYADQK